MQSVKYADAVSPDIKKSSKSGVESEHSSSVSVNRQTKRKSKLQGNEKCAKKLAIEPEAVVIQFFISK